MCAPQLVWEKIGDFPGILSNDAIRNRVFATSEKLILQNDDKSLWVSTNGSEWEQVITSLEVELYKIVELNGVFFALTYEQDYSGIMGSILSSENLSEWSEVKVFENNNGSIGPVLESFNNALQTNLIGSPWEIYESRDGEKWDLGSVIEVLYNIDGDFGSTVHGESVYMFRVEQTYQYAMSCRGYNKAYQEFEFEFGNYHIKNVYSLSSTDRRLNCNSFAEGIAIFSTNSEQMLFFIPESDTYLQRGYIPNTLYGTHATNRTMYVKHVAVFKDHIYSISHEGIYRTK